MCVTLTVLYYMLIVIAAILSELCQRQIRILYGFTE